jgi:2-C-methyl-D-erythritol 2,4-cyclodiphosphate synthase
VFLTKGFMMIEFRTGIGYDVHKLVTGRKCIIGGVHIPHETGLLGHSDADVLAHAVADAVLGAMGLGDIGTWFPDTDMANKDLDSMVILQKVKSELERRNLQLINVDAVVICERPKINPHKEPMQQNMALALGVAPSRIGIKATTSEKMGFIGRGEGIAVQAVASVAGIFN